MLRISTATRGARQRAALAGLALVAMAPAGANPPVNAPAVVIPYIPPRATPAPQPALPVVPPTAVAPAPPKPAAPALSAPGSGPSLATLASPVDDCQVTSPFGWRIHPILRLRRFHNGVDFGAPEGTPVHAAEAGVIEEMHRRGHYGYYLRIRHSDSVETAYAHLQGFEPGLAVGDVVTRGQVVARVGRTGWATGPHLYYEVIVDGQHVDPDRPGLKVLVGVRTPPRNAAAQTTGGAP